LVFPNRTHMKTTLQVLLLIAVCHYAVTAQSLRYSPAQPYTGLSAYSRLQNDPLSFTGNQSALTRIRSAGFGIYGERRFMLRETAAYTLAASMPTRLGNIGIQLNYAGFKNFNEHKMGLAYARKLGKKVDLGVQFNYYGYRVPAYGNASTVNFELGLMLGLTEKLHAGVHVYNPVGGKLGKSTIPGMADEKIAAAYKLGLGYDASEQFFIGSEIIKEEDKAVSVIAGFQYRFAKQFFVRGGIITESTAIYAGAGLAWKKWRLDITSGYHSRLGFSPGILLIMHFNNTPE
jgi:hypothetical protein